MKDSLRLAQWFYNRYFFSEYFLKENWYIIEWLKKRSPSYFAELWKALDNWKDVNLILPRWHAKTTWILIRIIHAICYAKERGIIYLAKWNLWLKFIGRIRWELETNEKLISYFWSIIPQNSDDVKDKRLKKRQQKFLEFTNGVWIQTISLWQTTRWMRATKVIWDDVQDNRDVSNKETVEKFNNWIFTSVYNTMLPWWSMAVVWTMIWELCLVKYLRDEKKRHTIEYEACNDNFQNILRPEMWNSEELKDRCEALGTVQFNQEFRNIPMRLADWLIKPHWIRYRDENTLPDNFDSLTWGVDPAQTEKQKSDFTWHCLIWKKWDKYYVLRSWGVKLSPLKNEEFLYNLYIGYKPAYNCQYKMQKEDNIEMWITEHLRQRWCNVVWVRAKTDKFTRLWEVAWKIEFGNVFFWPGCENLIYQITHYPDVEHDDEMDWFVWAMWEKKKTGFFVSTT